MAMPCSSRSTRWAVPVIRVTGPASMRPRWMWSRQTIAADRSAGSRAGGHGGRGLPGEAGQAALRPGQARDLVVPRERVPAGGTGTAAALMHQRSAGSARQADRDAAVVRPAVAAWTAGRPHADCAEKDRDGHG